MSSLRSNEARVNLREREGDIQAWQQRLRQMSYRSSAGDLASDIYYLKIFAVSERLQAAISEPLAPFTTIQAAV